jgi:Holliday junction DNA helicase RuvB
VSTRPAAWSRRSAATRTRGFAASAAAREFIGQAQARANLAVFIEAARARKERSTTCCSSARRLGKTTLAQIVSRELGVNFPRDLRPGDRQGRRPRGAAHQPRRPRCLFIDEIHRLNPAVEEILYPAMEDFQLDLIIGEGPAARSVKIDLAQFTLVGATTRAGPAHHAAARPLRHSGAAQFLHQEELELIVTRGARVLGIAVTADGADEIARRARGTPRIAGRCSSACATSRMWRARRRSTARSPTRRCSRSRSTPPAWTRWTGAISRPVALNYGGGPVGVETIAAALSEPRDAIEEIIEPFLIQQGFLQRTPRGRLLTGHAFRTSGSAEPQRDPGQFGLFNARRRMSDRSASCGADPRRRARAAGAQARHRGLHAAGGKRDPGEDDVTALARELDEELGCRVVRARPRSASSSAVANETAGRYARSLCAWVRRIAPRAEIENPWIDPSAPRISRAR